MPANIDGIGVLARKRCGKKRFCLMNIADWKMLIGALSGVSASHCTDVSSLLQTLLIAFAS